MREVGEDAARSLSGHNRNPRGIRSPRLANRLNPPPLPPHEERPHYVRLCPFLSSPHKTSCNTVTVALFSSCTRCHFRWNRPQQDMDSTYVRDAWRLRRGIWRCHETSRQKRLLQPQVRMKLSGGLILKVLVWTAGDLASLTWPTNAASHRSDGHSASVASLWESAGLGRTARPGFSPAHASSTGSFFHTTMSTPAGASSTAPVPPLPAALPTLAQIVGQANPNVKFAPGGKVRLTDYVRGSPSREDCQLTSLCCSQPLPTLFYLPRATVTSPITSWPPSFSSPRLYCCACCRS